MTSSLLNIGVQALNANQTALSYTGQNIANVNTEGYTRQRVDFATREPPILGVQIADISRVTDQYLVRQVWKDQSAAAGSEQYSGKIALLDKLMVSDATNLSGSLDSYFSAMQAMVDDPLYVANRQLFLAEAQATVNDFKNFDQKLRDQQVAIDTEIRSLASTVNSITANIAQLNNKIQGLASAEQNYNTLVDERDVWIKELSKYISIDVQSSNNGVTQNILLPSGEPLVSGTRSVNVSVTNGNPDPFQVNILIERPTGTVNVTDQLGQGQLGSLFAYRDEVLQPTINEIGRLAVVFAASMNEQHRKGMDLNGEMGLDLFNGGETGIVYAAVDNRTAGSISTSLRLTDVSALTGSEYEVDITGVDSFRVVRKSDGRIFNSSELTQLSAGDTLTDGSFTLLSNGAARDLTVNLDGFTFNMKTGSVPITGDKYLLQPTKNGAKDLSLAITQPEMLALASMIRVEPAATNMGNIQIDSINVTDGSDQSNLRKGSVEFPLQLKFGIDINGDPTYTVYDLTDPANPSVYTNEQGISLANISYVEGEAIRFDAFEVTLVNQPKPGDSFTIELNSDGYSDNRNALALADLQNRAVANGYSLQDSYGQLLAKVGTQANTASVALSANRAVLSSSENALQSIAGVNLDEEASKLIQYQQAYTASTRLITASQTIFDSLMQAVR